MMRKTIICVAPLGAWAQKADKPRTPITPAEIAADVVECAKAGAAVAHVHARRPDGGPTQDTETYREIVSRIREKSDIVVQISIGTRGFSIDDALAPIALQPEMASFPLRVLGDAAEPDPLADMEYMARRMTEAGVCPELDGATEEMLAAALAVRERGALVDPMCFGLILKEPETERESAASADCCRPRHIGGWPRAAVTSSQQEPRPLPLVAMFALASRTPRTISTDPAPHPPMRISSNGWWISPPRSTARRLRPTRRAEISASGRGTPTAPRRGPRHDDFRSFPGRGPLGAARRDRR